MKYLVGALAAVTLLVGVAASQPAEARCFWNSYAWECWHHPRHVARWHDRHWAWDRPHWYFGWDRY